MSASLTRAALRSLVVVLCAAGSQAMLLKRYSDPYSQVGAHVVEQEDVQQTQSAIPFEGGSAQKYLIASFPRIRQVAYCKLPDNVWYPLVLGEVGEPTAVAADIQSSRFFVADPANHVIWWYNLKVGEGGHLATDGGRHAAVENITAHSIAVNSVGDLYFSGTQGTNENRSAVFRQDAKNLVTGKSRGAVEVYTRDNSGLVAPAVWEPSGIAVDSLFVYWGNQIGGTTHGSVVKGTRANIGLLPQQQKVEVLSQAVDDVRGMAATGTHVFYTSPQGVYGVLKTAATPVTDPTVGLVGAPLAGGEPGSWNPTSIAYDGDSTLFFTETSTGAVYSLPSLNMKQQAYSKHADAPGVYGVTSISFERAWTPSGNTYTSVHSTARRGGVLEGGVAMLSCIFLLASMGASIVQL